MEVLAGAVITAVLGPLIVAWFNRRDMKRRVGTPNGQGTLVQMAEKLLAGQATQDERLGRLEGTQAALVDRVRDLEHSQGLTLAD